MRHRGIELCVELLLWALVPGTELRAWQELNKYSVAQQETGPKAAVLSASKSTWLYPRGLVFFPISQLRLILYDNKIFTKQFVKNLNG